MYLSAPTYLTSSFIVDVLSSSYISLLVWKCDFRHFQGFSIFTRMYAPLPTHAALISSVYWCPLTTCLHDGAHLSAEGVLPSHYYVSDGEIVRD
jgi:hypothetical protein